MKRLAQYLVLMLVSAATLPEGVYAQLVIHVDISATGADDGTSWTDAFVSLQDALAASNTGDEIWVVQGTYKPDNGMGQIPGDRRAHFLLDKSISLYGGFDGTEILREQRDISANTTILSGDLQSDDVEGVMPPRIDGTDNSVSIIQVDAPLKEAAPVLDGFEIRGGHANLTANGTGDAAGGAIFIVANSHVQIQSTAFVENFACGSGGAIFSRGTFTITDSSFLRNQAGACPVGTSGGAIYVWASHPTPESWYTPSIRRTSFIDNFASDEGGAIFTRRTSIHLDRAVFERNQARSEAGAVAINAYPDSVVSRLHGSLFLSNSALSGSPGSAGGAVAITSSRVEIANSVFNGNRASMSGGVAGRGGALSTFQRGTEVVISNSTFVHNTARQGSAIFHSSDNRLEISNSIFWLNVSDRNELMTTFLPATIAVSHSIIQGGLTDEHKDAGGNISVAPEFVDAIGVDEISGTIDDDLRLVENSPAVDVGLLESIAADFFDLNNNKDVTEPLPFDFRGEPRILARGQGSAIVDLGAVEFSRAIDTSVVANSVHPHQRCSIGTLEIFPNPTQGMITLRFPVPLTTSVSVRIFDIIGRLVDQHSVEMYSDREIRVLLSPAAPGLYSVETVWKSGATCRGTFLIYD